MIDYIFIGILAVIIIILVYRLWFDDMLMKAYNRREHRGCEHCAFATLRKRKTGYTRYYCLLHKVNVKRFGWCEDFDLRDDLR